MEAIIKDPPCIQSPFYVMRAEIEFRGFGWAKKVAFGDERFEAVTVRCSGHRHELRLAQANFRTWFAKRALSCGGRNGRTRTFRLDQIPMLAGEGS